VEEILGAEFFHALGVLDMLHSKCSRCSRYKVRPWPPYLPELLVSQLAATNLELARYKIMRYCVTLSTVFQSHLKTFLFKYLNTRSQLSQYICAELSGIPEFLKKILTTVIVIMSTLFRKVASCGMTLRLCLDVRASP